jgi:error-prone DNA polymerase
MTRNGYAPAFAEAIFKQMLGFGDYGFPESHAVSFALLAYVSSWLKCHEPACFLVALLNSQPMGFYQPAQLVYDARRHGVEVRAVDVTTSDWDCRLEGSAVRLGLCMVAGFSQKLAGRLRDERSKASFSGMLDFVSRTGLTPYGLQALADADALLSLSGHRRQQIWAALAFHPPASLLADALPLEAACALAPESEIEAVASDYASTGLTLRSYPLALLRDRLSSARIMTAAQLQNAPNGHRVCACGIVTARQQPQTARGVVFVTLEDETGSVNVIVSNAVRNRQHEQLLRSRLLGVRGRWQSTKNRTSQSATGHILASSLEDMTPMLGELTASSRDFH